MDQKDPAEKELIRRFQGGDRESFGKIVELYRDKLIQFVVWTAPEQRDSAEDIVQEVFVKVYRNPNSFKARSSFKVWIYGVTRMTALDWRRNYFRSIRSKISFTIESENEYLAIPEIGPGQAAVLENQEDTRRLKDAVEMLPDKLKTVLLLREWEDLSYEDIADLLDLPVGTVRSRLHNARALLAKSLNEIRYEI